MTAPSSDPFDLQVARPSPSSVLVTLSGELDIASSGLLTGRLAALAPFDEVLVVVDLARLTFVDSSGINAFVRAARAVESGGGTLVLAAPGAAVRRVFEIARVADVVAVAESSDAALAAQAVQDESESAPDGRW